MEFAPEYFKGEIRDGFYVQPMMKCAWAAQIEVLEEIERICRRHQITYIAMYGTLLGAIRHKGFIPWDDDMDIGMPRVDYERFIRYAKEELPEGWGLYYGRGGNFDCLLMRVINSSFELRIDEAFLEKNHGCPYEAGIDIFPIDNIPDDEEQEAYFMYVQGALSVVNEDWDELEAAPELMESRLRELEELTGQQFDRTEPLRRQVLHMADRAAAIYWNEKTEKAAFVADIGYKSRKQFPRRCLDKIIYVPFENTVVPVPEEYDEMLKAEYGENYMTPVISFQSHDYPFFAGHHERLVQFFEEKGMELPECFHTFLRKEGKPLVSVIIPCHDAESHIDRCLQSLMCQSIVLTNLEIICVEMSSADGTMDRLEAWEKKLNDLITVVQAGACSAGEARNIGLQYATAEYVTFMEADDWVEIDYLEKLYCPLERAVFDVVACAYQADNSEELTYFSDRQTGKENRSLLMDSEEKQNGFISLFLLGSEISGKIIKRQLLEEHQLVFQEKLGPVEQKLYFEMRLHTCAKQVYLHEEKLYHRYVKSSGE